jgi:hypothetical protein
MADVDDAIQTFLVKHFLPTMLLECPMFSCDGITFQIDDSTPIEKISAQIANNIVQQSL